MDKLMAGYYKLFILLSLIVMLFCSKQEKETAQREDELTFEVDTTKLELSKRLVDWGIEFNFPKDWNPIDDELFNELNDKASTVNLSDSIFSCQPILIFFHHDNKSMLFISSVPGVNDTSSFAKYKNLIQEKLSPRKAGDFLKDQILFSQFLIQDELHVNFKLLFQNKRHQLIQFDYIIPIHSYVSELKAIEASIGSIHLINLE
jgi:hypothetical protein